MKKVLLSLIYTLATLTASTALSQVDFTACLPNNQIWIAPEFYHMQRHREGGTKQDGFLYGGRLAYERIHGKKFYVGVEGAIATGNLEGHSSIGQKLRSRFTDKSVEGRIGYTFQFNTCYTPWLTPYIGYGHFWETNKYQRPKDLQIHFYNDFSYVPIGFLLQLNLQPHWSVGLNFKCRVLIDSQVKSKRDSIYGNTTLHYKQKLQYRIELPLSYYAFCFCHPIRLTIEPFYEYRRYGTQPNYPFDFLDTKFNNWGANFQIGYFF